MAGPSTPGQRTPGRTRKPEPYIGFNARPKDVGSRTGLPMPQNTARDSAGYELAKDFFDSPAGTEAPTTAQTIRTSVGVASSMRRVTSRSMAAAAANEESPVPIAKRSRMSQMAPGSDEEDGSGLGPEGILEDDGVLSHRLSSPAQWYETNEVPNVPLPRISMLPPPTPQDDYERLPTPQKTGRKSRPGMAREAPSPAKSTYSHLGPSPAKSTTSSRHVADELDLDLDDMDDDDMDLDLNDDSRGQIPPTPSAKGSPARRKSKKSVGAQQSPMASRKSESRTKGKTKVQTRDEMDEDEDVDEEENDENVSGGASQYRVPDSIDVGRDEQFDGGDDVEDYGPGDDLGDASMGNLDDGNDDADDDVDLEAQAIARENESGSEAEQEPTPRNKRPQPRKKSEAIKPRSRAPSQKPKAEPPQKKRSRVSRIGLDENAEDGYHGDFKTRSGRRHIAPLAYWRGDHINYKPGNGLAIPAEVVRVSHEETGRLGAKKKGRSRSYSVKLDRLSEEDEHEGCDDNTQPSGVVMEYKTGREISRRIAYPKRLLNPSIVSSGDFKYQKIFGEDQFVASGVVYIPVKSSKPAKSSKDNSYAFYVIRGAVQVLIHKQSFAMGPGAMFMVPRGNNYKIENVGHVEAELFFAQARKIRTDEKDDDAFEKLQEQSQRGRSASVATSTKGTRESIGSLRRDQYEDEQDDDQEEEEEEEEVEEQRTPKVDVRRKKR